MMTTKYKSWKSLLCLTLFFIFSAGPLFSEEGKWVIAAQKFKMDEGLTDDSVNSKTAELIPSDILEKIGSSVIRNVYPDEQFERIRYQLHQDRLSLYLQLSSEYKKRDSHVLNNYSNFKMKSAIRESDKKIKELQKKINANLEELKNATKDCEERMAKVDQALADEDKKETELNRYLNLFKNIFIHDESIIQKEEIAFYNNDYSSLFNFPENQRELPVTDPACENTLVKAGINTLITGRFSKYGDYISVYVDLYSYPGVKKIGSVVEVGSVNELELINTNIVMQLIPMIANSIPVQLEISITPEEAESSTEVYIDNVLQKLEKGKVIVHSGINTIQFVCDGYKSAGTTYNFEGNKKYKIEVTLVNPETGFLQVELRKPLEGSLIMNGEHALQVNNTKSQIAINGRPVLGEFLTENDETAFFYIPEKLAFDGSYVTINPKPKDRMDYIDKRRKLMYLSYSLFVVSLIPTFYTYGNYQNYVTLYKNYQVDFETANKWQTATNVTRFISISCGVLWAYELVRYLIAANSVLPQNARAGDPANYQYYEPPEKPEENETDAKATETKVEVKTENKLPKEITGDAIK